MNLLSFIRYAAFVPAALMAPHSQSANPAFQDAVFAAAPGICANFPTSPVCTQPNLSGASESSLAPTQSLSSNDGALEQARKLAKNGGPGTAGGRIEIGPFSLLFNGRASGFEREPDPLERGYDGDAFGVQLGLDKRLSPTTVVGGFLAFERRRLKFGPDPAGVSNQANEGTSDADTLSLVVFGAHTWSDALHVEGAAGFGRSDHEFVRSVYYQPTGGGPIIPVSTRGDTDGKHYWLSLSASYELSSAAASLTPFARLTYARSTVHGYSETELTATGLHMRYSDARRTSLAATLGVRAATTKSYAWGVLVPYLVLEYEHEFENDPQRVDSAFVLDDANTLFTPTGRRPDRNYFNVGAGAQFILPKGWLGFLEVEALLGQRNLERKHLLFGLRKEL